MRPVRRNTSPQAKDFDDHTKAKRELISRLGCYCSYCERRIPTMLAVEHIQPKALTAYASLIGRWDNFLLACVNCNSTKQDKDVVLAEVLLPDRDNTFAAFDYTADGKVVAHKGLSTAANALATATLGLVGLDKVPPPTVDANANAVALDRVSQRMNAWLTAQDCKADIEAQPVNVPMRKQTVRVAIAVGYFSIWMKVFEGDTDMRTRLIDAFAGTRQSGCFDRITTTPVSPAPNPDGLPHGGKV